MAVVSFDSFESLECMKLLVQEESRRRVDSEPRFDRLGMESLMKSLVPESQHPAIYTHARSRR